MPTICLRWGGGGGNTLTPFLGGGGGENTLTPFLSAEDAEGRGGSAENAEGLGDTFLSAEDAEGRGGHLNFFLSAEDAEGRGGHLSFFLSAEGGEGTILTSFYPRRATKGHEGHLFLPFVVSATLRGPKRGFVPGPSWIDQFKTWQILVETASVGPSEHQWLVDSG